MKKKTKIKKINDCLNGGLNIRRNSLFMPWKDVSYLYDRYVDILGRIVTVS